MAGEEDAAANLYGTAGTSVKISEAWPRYGYYKTVYMWRKIGDCMQYPNGGVNRPPKPRLT